MSRFERTFSYEWDTNRSSHQPLPTDTPPPSSSLSRNRFNFSNSSAHPSPDAIAQPTKNRFSYLHIQEPQSSEIESTEHLIPNNGLLALRTTQRALEGLPPDTRQLLEPIFDNPFLHQQLKGLRKRLKKNCETVERTQVYQQMGGHIFEEVTRGYRDTIRKDNSYLLHGRPLDKLFQGRYMMSYFRRRPDPRTTPDFIEITDMGDHALLTGAGEIGSHVFFDRWWAPSENDSNAIRNKKKQMRVLETGMVMEHFIADPNHTEERLDHVHSVIAEVHPELAGKPLLYDPDQYHMELWLPEGSNSDVMILNGTVNETPIKLATINKILPSIAIDIVHAQQQKPPTELFQAIPSYLSSIDAVAGGDD